ncbi:MAG: Hsp70 family protein [Pirellulaceae bacterium]
MPDSKKHPAVGIDLGTTFSAVAFLDNSGRPETIRSAEGDMTTPSAVFFDRKNPIVGIEAIEAGMLEPERLAMYAKRDVGEGAYEKSIRGESFPPEVLQALILQKLKSDAELKLGTIDKVVVTVPAFFNEPCRKATQDAGRLAGLEVLDIINEPTAAAITYGVQQGFLSEDGMSEKLERVLVYDLGGGTFDVTVMEIDKANYHTIATAGDVYLGGIDWDRRIVDFIADAFLAEHGIDPREDPRGEQELVRKANQTKHALTQRESVSIAFAFDDKRLRTELTQEQFAKLTEDLVERTLMTVQLVLDDAALTWSDLTRLILVGGSTRMPMIRDELQQRSGIELDRSLSPDEAVCHGAALYAGMLLGHPDGEHAKVSVTNVNSHDLGILAVDPKTGNPRRQVMIPRNSTLPIKKGMRFRTHSDNQVNVKIEIVEGGDDKGVNATKIGKCVVDDLPDGLAKGTEVDVSFDYSQDGRLTVSASLPTVQREVQMALNRAAGLSDAEIQSWQKRIADGLADPIKTEQSEPAEQASNPVAKPIAAQSSTKNPFAIVTDKSNGPAADKPKRKTKPPTPVANTEAKPSPMRPVIKVGPSGDSSKTSNETANKIPLKKPPAKKLVAKPMAKVSPMAIDTAPIKKSQPAKTPPKKLVNPVEAKNAVTPDGNKPIVVKKVVKRVVKPGATGQPTKVGGVTSEKKSEPTVATKPNAQPKPMAQPKPLSKPTPTVATDKKAVASGPKLTLGNVPTTAKTSVKPGEPDFAKLMSLGGQSHKPASVSKAPFIITTDGPSVGKKKSDQKSRTKDSTGQKE